MDGGKRHLVGVGVVAPVVEVGEERDVLQKALEPRASAVAVAAGGEPLPALDRPGLLPVGESHAIAFSGHSFELNEAAVLALPAEPASAPESDAGELTDANSFR